MLLVLATAVYQQFISVFTIFAIAYCGIFTVKNEDEKLIIINYFKSATSVRYAFESILEVYSDSYYALIKMTDEECVRLFGKNDWKEFAADKQLIFEDNELFVVIKKIQGMFSGSPFCFLSARIILLKEKENVRDIYILQVEFMG